MCSPPFEDLCWGFILGILKRLYPMHTQTNHIVGAIPFMVLNGAPFHNGIGVGVEILTSIYIYTVCCQKFAVKWLMSRYTLRHHVCMQNVYYVELLSGTFVMLFTLPLGTVVGICKSSAVLLFRPVHDAWDVFVLIARSFLSSRDTQNSASSQHEVKQVNRSPPPPPSNAMRRRLHIRKTLNDR